MTGEGSEGLAHGGGDVVVIGVEVAHGLGNFNIIGEDDFLRFGVEEVVVGLEVDDVVLEFGDEV